jgi:putative oxidoreductase
VWQPHGLPVSDTDAVSLALLALRVVVGVVMVAHGVNHIVGGGRIAGTARWFASLGMRPGPFHAWLASLTEIGAGALLVLGLFTPFAAAAVVGTMAVAWTINHRGNGFFIFRPGEGWEYVMVLCVVGAVIGALGPGEWSLDHVVGLDDWAGASGLLIAAVGGLLGAAALLAVFWRRPIPES